ncbi:MAG: cytidylate kinase [Candidatus Parvibacillus calidus]|nr:MAG: cytidylate kinase [Candidatus Parvibacillus calidus]
MNFGLFFLIHRVSKKINIAIDGFSGCGKSTLARAMAHELNYIYIDSGAMYRAVTWLMIQKGVNPEDTESVHQVMDEMDLHFKRIDKVNHLYLNGRHLRDEIRTMEVNNLVSQFSTISIVRSKLVQLQKKLAEKKGCVMDGRDIGTVVLKDAELKLFLVCEMDIRVARRKKELEEKNIFTTFESVKENFIERDRIDSTRDDSPLQQASDAILLDNSHLGPDQLLLKAMELAYARLG